MTGGSKKNDFFTIVPRKAALVFFLAVFFTFAPIGSLFITTFAQDRPWSWWLIMGAISGSLAVCWAGMFSLSRWFIPGIVVCSIALMLVSGSNLLGVRGQPSLEGLAIVFSIVLGYVLFIVFMLAGHHPIVLHRAASSPSRPIERLAAPGLPLGLIAGSTWEVHETELAPGDLLAVYTDGLNETMNGDDEELGHDLIEEAVTRLAAGPLDVLESTLFELASRHGPQNDDCSLLLARIR